MKRVYARSLAMGALFIAAVPQLSVAQSFTEGFNNVSTLTASGWSLQNLSSPIGTTGWFQGNTSQFSAVSGPANSYIAADQNNAGGVSGSTISNWLLTPSRTFRNGDTIYFYTRTSSSGVRSDRLQVRRSLNGTSTNVGTTATSVGDFTTLLQDINPNENLTSYPTTWTRYTIILSGISTPTAGRIGFRYFNNNAGTLGTGGNYIGIDSFQFAAYTCPTFTSNPASPAAATVGTAYSQSFTSTGQAMTPTYTFGGTTPPGLTFSNGTLSGTPTQAGSYNFTITSTDASNGCSGTKSYTLVVSCNTFTINPATLAAGTAGTAYSSTLTQTGGSGTNNYTIQSGSLPPGLSLSSAGVISGTPTAPGNYTFVVQDNVSSGCSATRTYTLTINCGANTASLAPFTQPVCSNGPLVLLTGGSPSGGIYSGNGVIGSQFNPSFGSQVITYSVTDQNGCLNTAQQTFNVNQAPVITFTAPPVICSNGAPFTIMASATNDTGAMFSGTGVSGNMFDPAAGTQTVKYIASNQFGCRDSVSAIFTVRAAPVVTLDTTHSVYCLGDAPDTIRGASPAGGFFFGTGVYNGNMFNPGTVGTYVINYFYSDSVGCTGLASRTITVRDCNAPTGIANVRGMAAGTLACSPNPTTGLLNIHFTKAGTDEITLRVMTIEGRVLSATSLKVTNAADVQLDLSKYPRGMCIITAAGASGMAIQKVVLQ